MRWRCYASHLRCSAGRTWAPGRYLKPNDACGHGSADPGRCESARQVGQARVLGPPLDERLLRRRLSRCWFRRWRSHRWRFRPGHRAACAALAHQDAFLAGVILVRRFKAAFLGGGGDDGGVPCPATRPLVTSSVRGVFFSAILRGPFLVVLASENPHPAHVACLRDQYAPGARHGRREIPVVIEYPFVREK